MNTFAEGKTYSLHRQNFCNVCQSSKLTPSAIWYLGRLLLLLLLANHLNNISSSKLVKASDHHLQGERGVVRGAEPCVTNLDHASSNILRWVKVVDMLTSRWGEARRGWDCLQTLPFSPQHQHQLHPFNVSVILPDTSIDLYLNRKK